MVCLALAPLVPITAAMVVPEALLRRQLQFRAIAVRTLVGGVVGGAAGVGLALAGAGVWALVVQQLVIGVVGLAVLWIVCPWRPSRPVRWGAIRDLLPFVGHATNGGFATLLCSRADQFVAGVLFGPVAVGIYRLAIRLPEMVVDVAARSLQQVALPALSRLQTDRAAFGARLADLQHMGAVTGLPLLGVLVAVAEPLVALLGPQWEGTALPLQLLCVYAAATVFGVILGPALSALGHPGRLAVVAWVQGIGGLAVLVVVGLAMTGRAPGTQAASLALTMIGVEIVVNIVMLEVTRRSIGGAKLRLLRPCLPAALAGVAAAAAPLALLRVAGPFPPVVQLAIDGAVAGLAAAAVLVTVDGRVRSILRRRVLRPKVARPAAAAPSPAER
jgi:PST family polysaccharide transporter